MKKTKFSEVQIAFILKQADDGTAVGEVCRKAGISRVLETAFILASREGRKHQPLPYA